MTQPLPPLPGAWRHRAVLPDATYLDNLALQLAHRRDLLTLPWLFGAWALAFAAATPVWFGGQPAAWVAVALFGVLGVASALAASRLRRRWLRDGVPLEFATPWPRGGYSDRAALRSLSVMAAVLIATTVFIALGPDAGVLPQAVALAAAVFAFAVTLVLPGVWFRRRRYLLLQGALAQAPGAIARLQASLDAAARVRGAASDRVLPFAPPGFPVECLGLVPAQPAAGGS